MTPVYRVTTVFIFPQPYDGRLIDYEKKRVN